MSGNPDIIRSPTALGPGIIYPFPSFSFLIGARLFWELQGLKAEEREGTHCFNMRRLGPREQGQLKGEEGRAGHKMRMVEIT